MTPNFRNQIIKTLKRVFIFSQISSIEEEIKGCDNKYLLFNVLEDQQSIILSSIVLSEKVILETINKNFEDKYTTPFLLYSLGYTYEEIASVLLLPTSIVKSRVFYFQQKMLKLLTEMNSCALNN